MPPIEGMAIGCSLFLILNLPGRAPTARCLKRLRGPRDNEHGTACISHHVLRHAANQNMRQPGDAVCGGNNQVHSAVLRVVTNLVGRSARLDLGLELHAVELHLGDKFLHLLLCRLRGRLWSWHSKRKPIRRDGRKQLKCMQQDEAAARRLGQPDRVVQSISRAI